MKKGIILVLTVVVVSAVVVSIAQPAFGYVVTVEVEGVVTEVQTWDGLEFDGSVIVGSIMTGYFTYDTEAPDENWYADGLYSVISVSMSVGSYTFTHDPASSEDAFMWVTAGKDFGYNVFSYWTLAYGPCYVNGEPDNLEDLDLSPALNLMELHGWSDSLISDALPDADSFPDFSTFYEREFFVGTDGGGPGLYIDGEVTSVRFVPEPGTVLLFGLGGLALRLRSGQALLRTRKS